MKDIDYTQTYSSMSDGELARLVSEGRDSLNDEAVQALNGELERRGLTDDLLAQEYPMSKATPPAQSNVPRRPQQRLSIKDFRLLRPWQIVVIALALVSTITFTIMRQREAKQDRLYWTVVTSIDTTKSRAAFNELITYRGGHLTQLVLRIATRNQPVSTQTEAIRFLAQTGDSETADRLAGLLRPYQGLAVRDAVADSLLRLPCLAECIRAVLDYRERMWREEPSVETLFGGKIPNEYAEEKRELDGKLDRVLLNHRQETLKALVDIYGLGEMAVSPFALHLTGQLKLIEACRLLGIDERFRPAANEQTLFPRIAKVRMQINATRRELNCESSPLGTP